MTMPFTLSTYDPYDFANRRHIGPSPDEMAQMLQTIGVDSLDALIEQTVPADIRQTEPLDWGALSESELLARMRAVAGQDRVMTSLIGQGYYGTFTPPCHSAQYFGKPGVVHRIYALSARNRPRPAGGTAELSNHGLRSDRPAGRQCQPAG